jgi:hypothetical protein
MLKRIKDINVVTIPHIQQRYNTVGDWQIKGDTLWVYISATGNDSYNHALAVHETIEALLCIINGVSEESVDEFDMSHPDLDEPGESPDAPYNIEHRVATDFEVRSIRASRVSFASYERNLIGMVNSRKVK